MCEIDASSFHTNCSTYSFLIGVRSAEPFHLPVPQFYALITSRRYGPLQMSAMSAGKRHGLWSKGCKNILLMVALRLNNEGSARSMFDTVCRGPFSKNLGIGRGPCLAPSSIKWLTCLNGLCPLSSFLSSSQYLQAIQVLMSTRLPSLIFCTRPRPFG